MNLRLEAAKEQQNILLFCLSTAEKKVAQHDGITAEKIADARTVRLRAVREKLARTLTELEQRSASTSFMTGEKLRELLPDAKGKWDKSKKEREERLGKLEKELRKAFAVGKGEEYV